MSWKDETVPLLRTLVGDYDSALYTDEVLERVLTVAAYQVYQEVDTSETYTISIADETISPDPVTGDNPEPGFVNLFTIKGACILDKGAALNAAKDAIKVTSHKHSFDATAQGKFRLDLLTKGWCATYEEVKRDFVSSGRNGGVGAAILTPFRLYYHDYGRYHYGCFR